MGVRNMILDTMNYSPVNGMEDFVFHFLSLGILL